MNEFVLFCLEVNLQLMISMNVKKIVFLIYIYTNVYEILAQFISYIKLVFLLSLVTFELLIYQ